MSRWLLVVTLAVTACKGEDVKVHVGCETVAGPAVECTVTQTAGKSEVEVCWDFSVECGNGVVVTAPNTCQMVKDGGTGKATIPGDKLNRLAECASDGAKPKAKVTHLTIEGKTSETSWSEAP